MEWSLVIAKGQNKGKTIPIRLNPFVIGRNNDCQLRPASSYVSQCHCMLIRRGNSLTLRDCHSTNGTYVNARRVGEVELRPGDRLEIGPLAFVVSRKGQKQQESPPLPRIVSEEAIAALLLEKDKEELAGKQQESGPQSEQVIDSGSEESSGNGSPDAAKQKSPLSPAEVAAAILKKGSFAWLRHKAGSSLD